MKVKLLFFVIAYYAILGLFLALGTDIFQGYTSNIHINNTGLTASEIDTGGVFSTGVSFARFFVLLLFGIGLPGDTPAWFAALFSIWQTLVTVLTIMLIISSIWDG